MMEGIKYTAVDFDPFGEDAQIEKTILINEAQREVWLSCTIGGTPASLAYNESISLDLRGPFNEVFFKQSLDEVVNRHEALRSAVSPNGDQFIIYDKVSYPLEINDLSKKSNTEQNEWMRVQIQTEMNRPFSLETAPLFRFFLHKLAETHYQFTLVIHHIIADGWSIGVLLEDLSALYNARVGNASAELPKLYQISDYAQEEAQFFKSEKFRETEQYWLNLYQSHIPVLDLPTDSPRPIPRSYEASRMDQVLSKELTDELKMTGSSKGFSFVNTLLSAFEVFISLKSGQRDIVIGLPSAGQSATEMFHLIGHCVNLMPLKGYVDPSLSFLEYLEHRKAAFFDAYDHQQISFGQLVKKLNLPRDPSRIPLVPVMFNIDMGMDSAVSFDGLQHRVISNPRTHETFELFLNATESQGTFILEWTYNNNLFKSQTISSMMDSFEQILLLLTKHADQPLKELFPELQARDMQLALADYTDLHKPLNPSDFIELIDGRARMQPDKVAVSYKNRELSYGDLIEKSNQLANFLKQKGVLKGDVIALALKRSPEMLIVLLGIIKAGAIYLPLDPEYPKDRLEFMLADSEAKFLITSKSFRAHYVSDAKEIAVEDVFDQLEKQDKWVETHIDHQDLVYILYTSGSTGKPKGVKVSHENLSNFLISMQASPGIGATDRLLAITTISFDIAGLELYLPLIAGAEIVMADSEQARDGRMLTKILKEDHITIMQATPSTWQMLIDSGWEENPGLKALCGGEALPKELAGELIKRCKEVWNMYGPTETTIWSAVKQIKSTDKLITIGRPILNTQMYILDEYLRPVSKGAIGEICIGGTGVAQGYLKRAELTSEKFVDDVYTKVAGGKLYRTGDLGKINENDEYLCLGRMDQQVKIRGHRIELGEIESTISALSGIKQSVVIAGAHSTEDKQLLAYVIPEENIEENDGLSWKERWDAMYDMGAEANKEVDVKDAKLDDTLLEHYHNAAELAMQSAEWLQSSISRIRAIRAKSIYEIGSGAGQLLFELAPDTHTYVATDYAHTAIDKLNERLMSEPEKWTNVKANTAAADDFSYVAGEKFDLVLIHSVAQYFQNADYLLEVVRKAAGVIEEGCIFIGDMQGKNSLGMCHAIDHLPRSSDESLADEFKKIVLNRVRIEDEFVADPAFFYMLPDLIPTIKGVNVQLRKGQLLNETTRYHYDIWLYVGKAPEIAEVETLLTWNQNLQLEDIEKLLHDPTAGAVEIQKIPNSRTSEDLLLWELVNTSPSGTRMHDIKAKLAKAPIGFDPQTFWDLAEKSGFEAFIKWTTDGADGLFDVTFIPKSVGSIPPNPYLKTVDKDEIYTFARTPFSGNEVSISAGQIEKWKEELKKILPGYMVPGVFVGLKQFPLTANAKIDRRALLEYLPKTEERSEDRIEISKNEQFIANIWSEVLGIRYIGVDDDFFELGGHSILAVKVMVRIEKETGQRIPIAAIFENTTVRKLATLIEDDKTELKFESLIPLKKSGSKTPIYIIHGAGLNALTFNSVIQYMDEDQPVFGIQSLGLNGEASPLYSMEELADYYKQFILQNDPDGPYILAGYSFGGLLVFEMAKQLKAMGKNVQKIMIIDTYVGDISLHHSGGNKLIKKVFRQFNKLLHFTRLFLKEPKEVYDYQMAFLRSKINRGDARNEAPIEETLNYYSEIEKGFDVAYWNYVISVQDVKIHLFKVSKRIYFLDEPMYLGWRPFAKKGVEIHEVPGDHKTFMSEPNAQKFARILQDVADGA